MQNFQFKKFWNLQKFEIWQHWTSECSYMAMAGRKRFLFLLYTWKLQGAKRIANQNSTTGFPIQNFSKFQKFSGKINRHTFHGKKLLTLHDSHSKSLNFLRKNLNVTSCRCTRQTGSSIVTFRNLFDLIQVRFI